MKIQFRGLKDHKDEWAYGSLLQFDWQDFIVAFNSFEQRTQVKADTIGMKSPFTDKHGKNIYEGDIMKDHEGTITEVRFGPVSAGKDDWGLDFSYVGWHVQFIDGSFYALTQDSKGYCVRAAECEVIGNIHDDKELIS